MVRAGKAIVAIMEKAWMAIVESAEMAPAYIQLAHHASPCWLALYFSYKHKYNTNINTNINIDHSASRAIILHPIVSLVHCSQSSQPTLVMIIV